MLRVRVQSMVDIIIDDDVQFEPSSRIEEAVLAACASAGVHVTQIELCIRFAGDQAVQDLNKTWRNKDKLTDVLSFPMQNEPFDFSESLGDIALASSFVALEADRLQLPIDDHCLHLIIHATLHLLGFDHLEDADAEHMQGLETEAMHALSLHKPYPADMQKTVMETV